MITTNAYYEILFLIFRIMYYILYRNWNHINCALYPCNDSKRIYAAFKTPKFTLSIADQNCVFHKSQKINCGDLTNTKVSCRLNVERLTVVERCHRRNLRSMRDQYPINECSIHYWSVKHCRHLYWHVLLASHTCTDMYY